MAIEFRDYYRILGVARGASDEEIRLNYRRLARRYHPDLAGGKPDAESRFKELNEAYEVLGNRERRRQYDALDPTKLKARKARQARSRSTHRGPNFQFGGTGFSDFFDEMFGGDGLAEATAEEGTDRPRYKEQKQTAGESEERSDVEADMSISLREACFGGVRTISLKRDEFCQLCFGTGRVNGRPCGPCGGTGELTHVEKCQVRIPAGTVSGHRLRLAGKADGGDLYLRIRLERHPEFEVEGKNLVCEVEVAAWEAVLGGTVAVPTMDGKVTVRVPPGTLGGQRLRLPGRGMAGENGERGDLVAVVRVQVPREVSGRERVLWEEMAALAREREGKG